VEIALIFRIGEVIMYSDGG